MAKGSKGTVPTATGSVCSGTATATALRSTTVKTSQASGSKVPTYDQIAQRAKEIWTKKGCLPGQDEQNWLEAERQLKAELGRK